MTASGDTLYLQGESALYVYRAGDSGPTAYAWDADISSFTDEPGLEIGRLTVADGDRLHIFLHLNDGGENRNHYVKTLMGELTLEAGLASASSLREVEWPEDLISHYGSNSYAASCTDAFCAGGVLYLLSYGDRGTEACAIDLDSMDYARLPIEDVQMIVPYINGQVLAATGDGGQSCTLAVYDPESEAVTELCAIDAEAFGRSIADVDSMLDGLACDLQTGECYCICNGELRSIDLKTGGLGATLTDIPVSSSSRSAFVLDGGYYAYQAYQATLIRSLDPDTAPTAHLKVYDGAYLRNASSACLDFTNAHGDASVSITRDYNEQENLIQNMLSQDDRVDVYILYTDAGAYGSLFERGYMAELDSAPLQALVDQMYPGVQSAVTRDGALVALPVGAYCWSIGVSLSALERAGLDPDDLPSDWPAFLDFLNELPARLEGSGVAAFDSGLDQAQIRTQLLFMILEAWQDYASYTADAPAYDAPALRAILEKLEAVDFSALGLPEAEGEDASGIVVTSGGYAPDDVLLNLGIGATFGELTSGMRPLFLAMEADAPTLLSMYAAVAFVNPFSKNANLATQFLEALAATLPDETRYDLIPSLNEPVRGKYCEAELKRRQERVDALKRDLESAQDIDRPSIEASLQQAEAELADQAANGMAIRQEDIDWFRSHDDHVIVSGENWLYSDDSGEALDLVKQYLAKRIDLSHLLSGIDKKVQMMAREGN